MAGTSCIRVARKTQKGLIKAAARSKDPVIFLEHKGLSRRVQAKTPGTGCRLHRAIRQRSDSSRRQGPDSRYVGQIQVYMALELARQMDKDGVSLEVIDLRSIVPLDEDLIFQSVRKTSGSLDGPVVRVAARVHVRPFGAKSRVGCAPFGRRVAAWS